MSEEMAKLDAKIRFLISVPDWEPLQATPFQGFSPSLCERSSLLRFIQRMPGDVFECSPDYIGSLVASRISGQSPINWYGQSPRALRSMLLPIQMPFTVVMIDRAEDASDYQEWQSKCPGPVTIVAKKDGTINYEDLSLELLQRRFIEICQILKDRSSFPNLAELESAIRGWTWPVKKAVPFSVKGHATVAPNVAALRVCGYEEIVDGRFDRINEGEKPYLDQIVKTTNLVFDERDAYPRSMGNLIYPRQPDLNFYLPNTYDIVEIIRRGRGLDKADRRRLQASLRLIERQTSYNFGLTTSAQIEAVMGVSELALKNGAKPSGNPVMELRQRELSLGTEVVSCLASSEISAVVRLPNRLNRSRGVVRQFAQHYRSEKPQILKRAEMFMGVQRAIAEGFPKELEALLSRSRDGVRIIADAHIEWLDVDGIPLGIRYDVSRIPVTPGNLFVEMLAAYPHIQATPDAFRDVLVVSGLEEGDEIAAQFTLAFAEFAEQWRDQINIKFVRVNSRSDLISAINEFEGMLMLFDGHGSHRPGQPGVLWLGEEAVDVWGLRGEISRPPPIVILSACDTHAADRNHATVANGFLALGCRSVLGSVFPLHASHAAIFAARLLYRVSHYIPAALNMFKRSLTWLEVVSGMLRRQLVTDVLRHLKANGHIREADFGQLHFDLCALVDIEGGSGFSEVYRALLEYGISDEVLARETRVAISASSIISYLHLGRPETILINSDENISAWSAEFQKTQAASQST